MSNKCFSYIRYKHRRQNAVIQTFLLAPILGGTRKLKPGHMDFFPVSAGKTRQHKKRSEQTPKTRVGQKIVCAAAKIMASLSPPMMFDSSTISSGFAQLLQCCRRWPYQYYGKPHICPSRTLSPTASTQKEVRAAVLLWVASVLRVS